MSTATATFKPGTLVGFLHFDKGTCLSYGRVVTFTPGTDGRRDRISVRTADGREFDGVSTHPDHTMLCPMNATCEKCECATYIVRGNPVLAGVDQTGSARCPVGGFHSNGLGDWS